MKFYDAFGGIGGFRLGLERNGFKCVGYCDWDKHAVACYNANFGEQHEPTDITKLDASKLPDFDLLVGGFPCPAFSLAGKRKGIEEERGLLFNDLIRIAREKQPSHLLFENVKGLLSANEGQAFAEVLDAMGELGYTIEWQVLNSKHFSVPQNRERVFIHGFREGSGQQIFPLTQSVSGVAGADEKERGSRQGVCSTLHSGYNKLQGQGETYIIDAYNASVLKEDCATTLRTNYSNGNAQIVLKAGFQKTIYSPSGIAPTMREGHGDAIRIIDPYNASVLKEDCATTLRTNYQNGNTQIASYPDIRERKSDALGRQMPIHRIKKGCPVRRLTPTECERLQAFPDNWTKRAWNPKQGDYEQSDAQRYKQLGNAVTVNVIEALGRKLKEAKA